MVHRGADSHGKLRKRSRHVWPGNLTLCTASSSFKHEAPVRPDGVPGSEQPLGNVREFIPGDHREGVNVFRGITR